MKPQDISIIICCAGMGTRLGIGSTKALLDISGKSVITRQLELLKEYDDIRIVIGYQAEKVIEEVLQLRNDIMFAFNYDYRTTGEVESLSKALLGTRKYIVVVDGDILVNQDDFKRFLEYPDECIGVCQVNSDEPVYAIVDDKMDVVSMNTEYGTHEFSCLLKVLSERILLQSRKNNVYEMIIPFLPIHAEILRSRDIDTPDDYDRTIKWFDDGCK